MASAIAIGAAAPEALSMESPRILGGDVVTGDLEFPFMARLDHVSDPSRF